MSTQAAPLKPEPLEIRKVLVLSTSHLTKETCQNYKKWPFIAEYEEGCYFYVGPDGTYDAEPPEDLTLVLNFARENGCTEVKFDCDADTTDQLPVFDW